MNTELKETLLRDVLPHVIKPARYIGGEINSIKKDPDDLHLRVLLAFPEVYEIGMSYLGYEILYHILNRMEEVWAERAFAPWPDMEQHLRKSGLPLYSLESFTPLSQYDLIGFTLQYELTYTNVLNMLDLGNIPVLREKRSEDDPIVIAGGPCVSNPEPVSEFFDVVFLGDGEEALPEICRKIITGKNERLSRSEILLSLQSITGIYLPGYYVPDSASSAKFTLMKPVDAAIPESVRSRRTVELRSEFYPGQPIIPLIDVTHNRLSVEVMRGCTQGCRYCNAGMIYRPVRERASEDIVKQTAEVLPETGYDEVSFLSLSISDYSQLPQLLKAEKSLLTELQVNYSFPSMRIDTFTEEIAEYASNVRKSGFTFAPESGSPRLRNVINKNISDDDILNAVDIALRKGWRLLKFYFMIGLPTEQKEDIEAIADLIERVIEKSKAFGRVRFNVSVSPFSPKAHTPFQWEAQENKTELEDKIYLLRNRLRKYKQVKLSWRDPDVTHLETLLGRGDRATAKAIHNAWKLGARFDGWSDYFDISLWKTAYEQSGIHMEKYLQAYAIDDPLPWEHIDQGVTKSFLLKERHKAYAGKVTEDCRQDRCSGCGLNRKEYIAENVICNSDNQETKKAEKNLSEEKPGISRSNTDDSTDPEKIRIQYKKHGFARFLSHLDLIRLFYRAFRAAGISILYTEGYNPKPKISFSSPLSLGYSSDSEFMDVELKSFEGVQLKKRLNPHLPDGIEISKVRLIKNNVDSLSSTINEAQYELDISSLGFKENEFKQALNRLMSSERITVERTVKGKPKMIDIRPYIKSIRRRKNSLLIRTMSIESRSVRIKEILNQLLDSPDEKVKSIPVHRKAQFVNSNGLTRSPLDIVS